MQFDDSVSQGLENRVLDAWDRTEDLLPSEIFSTLDAHVDKVTGKNRGNKSSAMTVARKGPSDRKADLEIQNYASTTTIHHEIGHVLMDALGYDTTQEATTRASNKKNYSRWPQFAFCKRDSPVERFLYRRYGDLDHLPTHPVNPDELIGRSDIFVYDGSYYEAHTWQIADFDDHDRKRYTDPIMYKSDEPVGIVLTRLGNGTTLRVGESYQTSMDDIEMVNRYALTPGLQTITKDMSESWAGLNMFVYELNTTWYRAIQLVRKRDERRERGQLMAPRGKRKSYYLMNVHEYFAELHAIMMTDERQSINRLEKYAPKLITLYNEVFR